MFHLSDFVHMVTSMDLSSSLQTLSKLFWAFTVVFFLLMCTEQPSLVASPESLIHINHVHFLRVKSTMMSSFLCIVVWHRLDIFALDIFQDYG